MAARSFRLILWLVPLSLLPLGLGVMLATVLSAGPYVHGVGVDRLATWDALSYRNIALHGYQWDRQVGTLYGHGQNVAFFPLQPLLGRLVIAVAGAGPLGLILASYGEGLASAIAFHSLARLLLPAATATLATGLYMLWPASCFFLMQYPTGLINLLGILMLRAVVLGNPLAATTWCGLGTAAAPTMVFMAAAPVAEAGLRWWRGGMLARGCSSCWGWAWSRSPGCCASCCICNCGSATRWCSMPRKPASPDTR